MRELATVMKCKVRVGEKNPKNVWLNDVVKAAVKRKEAAWKEVLGARDEVAKDICMKIYKAERLKGVFIKAKIRSMNSLEGR